MDGTLKDTLGPFEIIDGGVYVTSIQKNTVAAILDLMPGDQIISGNQRPSCVT